MSVDYNAIGRRVSTRRKALQKTQEELAEHLAVSVGYVSQIERGVSHVNLGTLSRIADFLGCDLADLVSNLGRNGEAYLSEELGALYRRMDDQQRKLLQKIAEAIVQED